MKKITFNNIVNNNNVLKFLIKLSLNYNDKYYTIHTY